MSSCSDLAAEGSGQAHLNASSSSSPLLPGSPLISAAIRSGILHFPGKDVSTVTSSAATIGCAPEQIAKCIIVEPVFPGPPPLSKAPGAAHTKKKKTQPPSGGDGGFPTDNESRAGQEGASPLDPEAYRKSIEDAYAEKGLPRVFLIVLSGTAKVQLKKVQQTLAPLFGSSKGVPPAPKGFRLVPFDDVERLTGFAPGAVSPLGSWGRNQVAVYLDKSLREAAVALGPPRHGAASDPLKNTDDVDPSAAPPSLSTDPCGAASRSDGAPPTEAAETAPQLVKEMNDGVLFYCAGGTHDTAIPLTLSELERVSYFVEWVDVARSDASK